MLTWRGQVLGEVMQRTRRFVTEVEGEGSAPEEAGKAEGGEKGSKEEKEAKIVGPASCLCACCAEPGSDPMYRPRSRWSCTLACCAGLWAASAGPAPPPSGTTSRCAPERRGQTSIYGGLAPVFGGHTHFRRR